MWNWIAIGDALELAGVVPLFSHTAASVVGAAVGAAIGLALGRFLWGAR